MDTDKKVFHGHRDFRKCGAVGRPAMAGCAPDYGLRTGDWRLREQGVALVITLIMLSIITFMTVTFLVLSQRERNSTTTSTDQKISQMAADTAMNRAIAELTANMLVLTNYQNTPFLVSTSYVNYNGFVDGLFPSNPTNVNYSYEVNQRTFTGGPVEWERNISDLLYNPRVPVFVVTNNGTQANEFRFYLDLNRNGRDDPNGTWPIIVTDSTGTPAFLTTNASGQFVTESTNSTGWAVSNNFVGDPEWIGILERPQELHSADNRFVSRYAFIVIPAGNTLDINYIHNRAKQLTTTGEGFLRNQGAGTYEDNLAGFLADLNTNAWWNPVPANPLGNYVYNTNFGISTGSAFNNANDILEYRYGPNGYSSLTNEQAIFPNGAANLFDAGIDTYSQGPLMLGTANYTPLQSVPALRRWSGADNPNHVFTIQDFFNISEVGPTFPVLLQNLGTSNDTYDSYTYYRMLAQLGSDSAPEQGKMNINWKNTDNSGRVVQGMETNLIAWTPADFFTNAADRMFRQLNLLDINSNLITVTNIPIYEDPVRYGWTNNINYYTPAVHRILQMAANMYDASTSRFVNGGPTNYPSVFRPLFRSQNGIVSIAGYAEVTNSSPVFYQYWDVTNFATTYPNSPLMSGINLYGVPWIVGAKKGFPNFNEMSMNNPLYVQRTIMFTNATIGPPWTTNQMIQFAISNNFGVEAWNSYTNGYYRRLLLVASNELSIQVSNELGFNFIDVRNLPFGVETNLLAWPAWNGNPQRPDASFQVPLRVATNFVNGIYLNRLPYVFPLAPPVWGPQYVPHFYMALTYKFQFALIDTSSKPNRVIDFVNLVDAERPVDVDYWLSSGVFNQRDQTTEPDIWETNLAAGGVAAGIMNQIDVGLNPTRYPFWTDPNKAQEAFVFQERLNGQAPWATNSFADPYIAQAAVWQLISWQANDPLVHYTAQDMTSTNGQEKNYNTIAVEYTGGNPPQGAYLPNLGRLNFAYQPWGGNPLNNNNKAFDLNYQVKDPLIFQSDSWDFTTNKLPNIGWLGRVHRGTPWQTVYLKPFSPISTPWTSWANDNLVDTNLGYLNGGGLQRVATPDNSFTQPLNDYDLFDLFTVGLNDNATRGQLNVNQNGLAAWSAVLSAVNVLTNSITDPRLGLGAIGPAVISPAGVYTNIPGYMTPVAQIVLGTNGINATRANLNVSNGPVFLNHVFQHEGDVLATPALTVASPFLNTSALNSPSAGGISDEVLERIPQQIMSLLTLNQTPRFVIYSFGQTLHPADHSLVIGGTFNGLCTNYQVTAEMATRAVVRIDGSPDPRFTRSNPDPQGRYYPPHVVVEQFNVLPPD